MKLISVNKSYFQKSKVFIYPLLGIKKGESVSLIETYIGWKDKIHHDDCKLVCLYHLRTDKEFLEFEKKKLLSNIYFQEFFEVDGNKGVYIFDMRKFKDNWSDFLDGKYSKLNTRIKNAAINFQPKNTSNFAYINSFMYPEKYFGIDEELLKVDIKLLKNVGELCDKPDLEKEILITSVKNLEISPINT